MYWPFRGNASLRSTTACLASSWRHWYQGCQLLRAELIMRLFRHLACARAFLLILPLSCTTRADVKDAGPFRDAHAGDGAVGAPAISKDASASAPSASMDEKRVPGTCPEGMVYIPGGTFTMGLSKGGLRDIAAYARSTAPHKVTITKPYCIDRTEVTAGEYRKCVAAGACRRNHCNAQLDELVKHPMNCVNWLEADTYCKWVGKRLPTEAEWEFAARGPKSFRHPWGNAKPDDTKLWWSGKINRGFHTAPVGSYPKGASPFGVLDMEGNVSEWVADWYIKHPAEPQVDPIGPLSGTRKVLKPFSLATGIYETDVGERLDFPPERPGSFEDGFRCAATP
jgi:formylglycine-generating enzyme required for sulfatase activity